MSMSPENYRGMETKCNALCLECKHIIDTFESDNPGLSELDAIDVYDKIISMETELNFAIKNAKTESVQKRYEECFNRITSYKGDIYLIAHII